MLDHSKIPSDSANDERAEAHSVARFGEAFHDFDGLSRQFADLHQRWNDRIILERSSISKLYSYGRLDIFVYSDVLTRQRQNIYWLVRPSSDHVASDDRFPNRSSDPGDVHNGDDRNQKIVFVSVIEGMKPPVFVKSVVCGPYFIGKKFRKTGEGLLYGFKCLLGGAAWRYDVFPVFPHRKMDFDARFNGSGYAGDEVVQCSSEVMDRVSNYERERLRDFLDGPIHEDLLGSLRVSDSGVTMDVERVEGLVKGLGRTAQFVNVEVGPLDL